MSSRTVLSILDQIKDDLEFKDSEAKGERSLDPMVDDTYLIQKVNDSLEEIQTFINATYEDYFLTYNTTQMVVSQSEYSLPSDIYMNKIRRIWYHQGSNPLNNNSAYPLRRLMNIDDVMLLGDSSNNDYKYKLIDRPVTGDVVPYRTKLVTFPKGKSSDDYFTVWYIRELASVSSTGDTVELPVSAMRYMISDIKYKCLEKDVGNPMVGLFAANRKELKESMMQSILNKIPDDQDGYMSSDLSHYNESLLNEFGGGY